MANDKLHKSKRKARKLKRQERKARELGRPGPKREVVDRVLIVCEGSKTEPNYLKELISAHRLGNNAIIDVDGSSGSDPKSVVDHAERVYDEDKKRDAGNSYDQVFCVIDRDEHDKQNYEGAIEKIHLLESRKRKPKPFNPIVSVPCFEYWVLLHFEETAAPFERVGKRSPCDCVLTKVNEYMADYAKGMADLYECLKDNQEAALTRSNRILDAARQAGTDNPTTHMHELVEYLIHLKDKK